MWTTRAAIVGDPALTPETLGRNLPDGNQSLATDATEGKAEQDKRNVTSTDHPVVYPATPAADWRFCGQVPIQVPLHAAKDAI